jgi:hypothetical protein
MPCVPSSAIPGSLLVLALAANLFAQTPAATKPSASGSTGLSSTAMVSCLDPPLGTKTVRSEGLVAPDGKSRAYVEVESRAVALDKTIVNLPRCANTSRLWLREGSSSYRLIYLDSPLDLEAGNGLRLVDWSADGRRLLIERSRWQFESEDETRSVLLYDAHTGLFQEPDLDHIARKLFDANCALNTHVLGFAADGKILLEAHPLTPEEEEVQAVQSCVKKATRWKLAPASEKLEPVESTTPVQKYGKVQSPEGK